LKDLDANGRPDIQGVATTAQRRADSTAGLVHIQFRCEFGSAYSESALSATVED
jgi:hypothetical protein